MTTDKEPKQKKRYIADLRISQHQKPISPILDKDIQSAEKSDQNYALMKYRELVAARREKEKLRPREPEIYHHDIFKK
jgi:hypothetical protein